MKWFEEEKLIDLSKKHAVIMGVSLAAMILLILYLFNQGPINQAIGSLLGSNSKSQKVMTLEEVQAYYDSIDLKLENQDSLLIEDMRTNYVDVSAANRDDTALLTEVADNQEDLVKDDAPEVLPWYYYSPMVPKISPLSYANNYRLVHEDPVNQFKWMEHGGDRYLFQADELFTGWYNLSEREATFYQDGLPTDQQLNQGQINHIIDHHRFVNKLIPRLDLDLFFVEQATDYQNFYVLSPYEYPILFKNPDSMILSAPPMTKGSTLVTNTQNYVDMPLEVVGEYVSYSEEWLHVYIGYEELGWIKKDDKYEDYVLTYYSERDLLDTIEHVLEDEISYIYADVGASFINNETMAQVSVNSHSFFPASTQKIYVLGELYHQYKTGELSPWDTVVLNYWDKVPGAGIIQGYPDGSVFTLDELVNLVAIYSDNTAANLLIDAVGGGEWINPHAQQLGLYDTYIYGKYYQGDSYLVTTPRDAARYFALLYNDRVNGEPYDEELINKFFLNSHTYIRPYIPGSTTSWNKSGIGGTEQNDVATFVTPYGSYSLAVYTAYPSNRDATAEAVAWLSVRVHDVFNEIRLKLWETVEDPDGYLSELLAEQVSEAEAEVDLGAEEASTEEEAGDVTDQVEGEGPEI